MRTTGKFVTDSTVTPQAQSFVPKPLPPDPPLELTAEDYDLIDRANLALGRLDGLTTLLPDTNLLIYMYVRKEAVLSSQIEGTVSSLEDLLVHESKDAPGVRAIDDTQEVVNYVLAVEHGLNFRRPRTCQSPGGC